MQASSSTHHRLIQSRLEEFFSFRAPWHRRLWNIGTYLNLREVLEYTDACIQGAVHTAEGLNYVIETSRREIRRDPGVAHLQQTLDKTLDELSASSPKNVSQSSRDELEQLTRRAKNEYLTRWLKTPATHDVEYTARTIASHLLDLGYSREHLHRWRRAKRRAVTLTDFLEEASTMVGSMPPRNYEVFVPCSAPYRKPTNTTDTLRWVDGQTAAKWLTKKIPDKEDRRHHGGFLIAAEARDPWAAIELARTLVARADARVRVAKPSDDTIELDGWARIAEHKTDYKFKLTPRQVEIGSLHRQDAVYDFDNGLPTKTDDALLLASHMESHNPGAAITGGWAAIEALLIRPGENKHARAADRLAALITCSLPRAELTHLAYQHKPDQPDTLSEQLKAVDTSYQKVQLVEEHLKQNGVLELSEPSDIAAQHRVQAMVEDPSETLTRINRYLTESLRRLYNQRNTISHAGSLQSVTLNATTRTTFSLVGAGLDRIVHAQLNDPSLEPLALVARAETELQLLGTPGQRPLHQLLQ